MNLERPISISKRQAIPKVLAERSYQLADALAGGRWHLQSQRRIGIERFVVEEIGLGIGSADEAEATELITRAAFSAHKFAEVEENGRRYDETQYDLRLTIGQSLTKDEIPPNVLNEILVDGSEDDEDEGDTSVLEAVNRDNLDEFLLVREEEVAYRVDESGRILGYDFSHSYLIDDEIVFDTSYSSEESKPTTVATYKNENGWAVDRRPVNLRPLNENVIKQETRDIDAAFRDFLVNHSLRRSLELRGQSRKIHTQRALAIVGLVGIGLRAKRS